MMQQIFSTTKSIQHQNKINMYVIVIVSTKEAKRILFLHSIFCTPRFQVQRQI